MWTLQCVCVCVCFGSHNVVRKYQWVSAYSNGDRGMHYSEDDVTLLLLLSLRRGLMSVRWVTEMSGAWRMGTAAEMTGLGKMTWEEQVRPTVTRCKYLLIHWLTHRSAACTGYVPDRRAKWVLWWRWAGVGVAHHVAAVASFVALEFYRVIHPPP